MFSARAAITTVKWTLKCIMGIVAGLIVFFIVLGVQAAENPSSEWEDGGAPGQTVTPVELVIYSQTDGLDELDGIKHQTAGLQNHCEKQKSVGCEISNHQRDKSRLRTRIKTRNPQSRTSKKCKTPFKRHEKTSLSDTQHRSPVCHPQPAWLIAKAAVSRGSEKTVLMLCEGWMQNNAFAISCSITYSACAVQPTAHLKFIIH